MSLMKKRWLVLLASIIVNICIGTGFAWSVYQAGLFDESEAIFGMQVTKSQLSLAFTIFSGVAPICMIAGEPLQKKLGGPRGVIYVGGIMFGLGLILSGFINSLVSLYITYGVLGGLGAALAYGVTMGNTIKFFPEKRGLVAGITAAAYGSGSIIFPPIMKELIASYGTLSTFIILGIFYMILIFIAGIFIVAAPKGWTPEGYENKAATTTITIEDKNWKQMLKDYKFYLMFLVFTIFATAGLMLISQCFQMVESFGTTEIAALAALIVSIVAIGNTLGRLVWGFISDKIGRNQALIIMSAIICIAGISLYFVIGANIFILFVILAVLIAMCYGGSMGVYPSLTSHRYGLKNNGVNYGIMFTAFALGGFLGPVIANAVYTQTSSYATSLLIVGLLGLVALILIVILTILDKKERKKHNL